MFSALVVIDAPWLHFTRLRAIVYHTFCMERTGVCFLIGYCSVELIINICTLKC